MVEMGVILEIIGPKYVLIEGKTSDVKIGAVLEIFQRVSSEYLKSKYNLPFIDIPKGDLRIASKQEGKYYLGEVYKEGIKREKVIDFPTNILSSFLQQKTVIDVIPGPPSALLNPSTCDIEFNTKVQTGDYIGRS